MSQPLGAPGPGSRYRLRMLFRRRKRLQELTDREARGETLWTDKFVPEVRNKIAYAFGDAAGSVEPTAVVARQLILRDEGWPYLADSQLLPAADFLRYVMTAPDDMLPTIIEAMYLAGTQRRDTLGYYSFGLDDFAAVISTILAEHRIAFDFVDGRMIPFESKELHTAVVEPVVRLLSGRQGYESVESAYLAALHELSAGSPDDAITDAARALQLMLEGLGCEGNALGPLVASAKKRGLLGPHDHLLTEALAKTIDWVSADRTAMGDAHHVSRATPDDAWFTVHVVGAIIVRLAGGARAV